LDRKEGIPGLLRPGVFIKSGKWGAGGGRNRKGFQGSYTMEWARGVKGTKERGQFFKRIKEGVTRGVVKTIRVLGVLKRQERGSRGGK